MSLNFTEASEGDVNRDDVPALRVTNRGRAAALSTHTEGGESVRGETNSDWFAAVAGIQTNGTTPSTNAAVGVYGQSRRGSGVHGVSDSPSAAAVAGFQNNTDTTTREAVAGVYGQSRRGSGVHGVSDSYAGIFGKSQEGEGVHGETNARWGAAVAGFQNNTDTTTREAVAGVYGKSRRGEGVRGTSDSEISAGVVGIQDNTTTTNNVVGVYGRSQRGEAVRGVSRSDRFSAVAGIQDNTTTTNNVVGVYGQSQRGMGVLGATASDRFAAVAGIGRIAGRFDGDVQVTGDISLLGADCAEDFDVSTNVKDIEPGTVMTLNDSGDLEPSSQPYDTKVAGVISGAGGYKPGLLLDKQQKIESNARRRMPVALMGKVYCKVDATVSPIEVGDLLTTSLTEGHAMKASDPIKAFGTIIGKALKPLREGRGMIPVLVALQ